MFRKLIGILLVMAISEMAQTVTREDLENRKNYLCYTCLDHHTLEAVNFPAEAFVDLAKSFHPEDTSPFPIAITGNCNPGNKAYCIKDGRFGACVTVKTTRGITIGKSCCDGATCKELNKLPNGEDPTCEFCDRPLCNTAYNTLSAIPIASVLSAGASMWIINFLY